MINLAVPRKQGSAVVCASQDFPIEELLEFIFEGNGNGHLAVLFHEMIDDSADRDRQKVIISGALMGSQAQWTALRSKWRTRLGIDEIKYYKDSHCRNLRGQFFKYNSVEKYPPPLGRQAADAVRSDLEQIIKECGVMGIGCIIPVPLWKQLKNDPSYGPVTSKDAYHWAVQTVWTLTCKVLHEMGKGNIVAMAHDQDNNFPTLLELYRSYKAKNRRDAKLMASFIPLDDKTNPPIQAADVAASATYQLANDWVENPQEADLKRLRGSMYQISIWDEKFAKIVLDNELRGRMNQ